MESLSGKLLVAAGSLADPNFARTVVLVVHHDDDGAFGLVINRPGADRVKKTWEQVFDEPCPLDVQVLVGGPVSGPPMAIHANPAHAEHEVVPGVYFSGHRDHLAALVAEGCLPLRIIGGYAGWGPGQLEAEMEEGSWGMTDATADVVFGDTAALWSRVTRRAADERLIGWLGVRDVPEEPWHN